MEFIISVLIITVAFVLILILWGKFIEKVEPEVAESLCESFNAARMKFSVNPADHKLTLAPNSCNTIHKTGKNSLPESNYDQNLNGLKENIKRLMIKSWDMWLKGYEQNILDANYFRAKEKCFISYTFNVKEGMPQLNSNDFIQSLSDSIYLAEDSSDKCALTDLGLAGGFCMDSCTGNYPVETRSTQCKGKKCCISENLKNECENKGGKCSFSCNADEKEFLKPLGWDCADANSICCVNNKHIYSHLDYIQFYGGPGRVSIKENMNFCPQGSNCADTYAVVFVAQTTSNVLPAYFEGVKSGGILIAPLSEISDICFVSAEASGD